MTLLNTQSKVKLHKCKQARKRGKMWVLEVPPMTGVPPMMVAPMTSDVAASNFLLYSPAFLSIYTLMHSVVLDNISMHLSRTGH